MGVSNGLPDVFSRKQKLAITAVLVYASFLPMLETFIYVPAIPAIQEQLQTTNYFMGLTITVYLIANGVAPVIWASASDAYGRRPVYLATSLVCLIASILLVFTSNVEMLIALRLLQGAGSCAALSVAAGTVHDIYPMEERGRALSTIQIGLIVGGVSGPILGGTLTYNFGWRSIFILLAVFSLVLLGLFYFLVPETLRPPNVTSDDPSSKLSHWRLLRKETVDVLKRFTSLRYPFIALAAFSGVVQYLATGAWSNQAIRDMEDIYNFNEQSAGFFVLVLAFWNIVGSIIAGVVSDRAVVQSKDRHGKARPEVRLTAPIFAGLFATAGFLVTGWGFEFRWHYATPVVLGFSFSGFGLALNGPIMTYVVDLYPNHPAAMYAVLDVTRYVFGSPGPVIATATVQRWGTGAQYTLWCPLFLIASVGSTWIRTQGYTYRIMQREWKEGSSDPILVENGEPGVENST
ncbi:MFS general substrate transporter [Gonapodya prolifera JEL478]|uniref:MFS general substrate transporter n=1 Tax=Gonapodya prolifera (strain JEL478) TaxID=1344416 RepID=A0A139AQ98_GONPJ|nr:MFS general substrate transporter [Gonapodya prolifera JEL478]|eukprot:KXS18919.1 MFS general substrate transporter [Gonapodya prolifera JEL478]